MAVAHAATVLEDAARGLGGAVRAAGDEIERERRLPERLVGAFAEAGLFKMLVPRGLGGAEADPLAMSRVVEEVAAADASAGWLVNIAATSGIFAGFLPPEGAAEVFVPADSFVSFASRPSARAVAVDGGYRVSGRWPFASGSLHATWCGGGCIVHEGDAPRLGPEGKPEQVIVFVPRAAFRVEDTWHVSGLAGTGSNDVVVEDAFVPAARTVETLAMRVRLHQPGPLYVFGRTVIPAGLASVPLGVARGAVEALVDLAGTKPQRGGAGTIREREGLQALLGRAEMQRRAARALLHDSVAAAWDAAVATGTQDVYAHRGAVRTAAAHAAALAVEAVDLVWRGAGASAIFDAGPFARRFGDAHAATQNAVLGPDQYLNAGRALLGFPPPDLWT